MKTPIIIVLLTIFSIPAMAADQQTNHANLHIGSDCQLPVIPSDQRELLLSSDSTYLSGGYLQGKRSNTSNLPRLSKKAKRTTTYSNMRFSSLYSAPK